MKRIRIPSTRPPRYPATMPIRTPLLSAMLTEISPSRSEMRAPKITRESMSRPSVSVPIQCSEEGGRSASIRRDERVQQVELDRVERVLQRDPGREQRHADQQREQHRAEHPAAVAGEAAQRLGAGPGGARPRGALVAAASGRGHR